MNKPSWSAIVVVALFCALSLISCGPSKNDVGSELVSIEVTPANPVLVKGETVQFKATGHYSNNSTNDLTALVTWDVEATCIYCSINNTGFFTAGSNDTKIYASGGLNWQIKGIANVVAAVPQSITITPVAPIISVGSSLQFTATARFSDLFSYDFNRDVTSYVVWSLSDADTATINNLANPGLVTALAASATTTIQASYKKYERDYPDQWAPISGYTTITVDDAALVSIAITPIDPSVNAGNTVQFTATGTYSDTSTHDISSSVTWTSSDPGKATISATGLATGVDAGSTVISAASGTASNTTNLTVTGGVPSSTTIISTGMMMKGSAIVNGIQFSDTLANITADDTSKNASFLQDGMMVKIKGSRNNDGLTGTADEIHVENDVRGAVFLKGLDNIWVVGQTVYVDGGTIFANVADFAALQVGDNVEVYGMRNADGHIRATRVEKLATAGVDEVRGPISAKFGSASTTITIDAGSFNVDGTTTILPSGTSFDVGTLVEIKLSGLHVDQLKVEDAFDAAFKPAEGEVFSVEGFVTGFTSPTSSFFVNGQVVNASGASFSGGVSTDLNNDVKVEALGHYVGTVLVADTIVIK
jgi:hypothetical protein